MRKFRKAYDKQRRVRLNFDEDKGLTIQEQKDECDINHILEKYTRTGLINHVNTNEPQFGEFANFDFREQQTLIAKATQLFMKLPAAVRQQFDNDPAKYIEFVKSPENVEDMKDGVIDNEIPDDKAEVKPDGEAMQRSEEPEKA